MRRLLQSAPLLVVVLGAACSSGRGAPVALPPPVSAGPTPGSEAAPPPLVVRPYASGGPNYVVTTTARIHIDGDTAAAADTVETSFVARLLLERAGNRLFISGTIDSLTARGSTHLASISAAGPVRFHGEGTAFGFLTTFVADVPMSCDSPAEAIVASARDLVVPVPDRVSVGSTWSDTLAATVCRGGLPVTTTAVRQYTVRQLAPYAGTQALEVERTAQLTVAGSGTQFGLNVSVAGEGSATSTLFLDLGGGGLLGGSGESTAAVTFTGPRGTTTFRQTVRQRVERRDRGAR